MSHAGGRLSGPLLDLFLSLGLFLLGLFRGTMKVYQKSNLFNLVKEPASAERDDLHEVVAGVGWLKTLSALPPGGLEGTLSIKAGDLGRRRRTAVEHSPRDHEVEGSDPAGHWAFFFFYLFFSNFPS